MIRAQLKLIALVSWILFFYPFAWFAVKIKKLGWRDAIVRFCYRGILAICEVHVRTSGQLSDARPLLLVSNHLSYVDVAILGSQAAIRFTPKSEIESWPVVGSICKITGCVFIERKPGRIQDTGQTIASTLAQGEVVSLFPEATTGNGIHLVDFKPGFFSLAEEKIAGQDLSIQPVAIIYKAIRRLPIDTTQLPSIAWYGDMEFFSHIKTFLKLGRVDVELAFLPTMVLGQGEDRKSLAQRCQEAITAKIAQSRTESIPVYNKRFSMPAAWSRSKS
jgi:1-acyl-sn-glycerol-3-phosphate acyltransferase